MLHCVSLLLSLLSERVNSRDAVFFDVLLSVRAQRIGQSGQLGH